MLTYNIHAGKGTDGKFDYERLAKIINDCEPDLVALQEVDRKTGRASGVDQAKRLAKLTGLHETFGRAMYYDGGEYGLAVLSRWPIVESKTYVLPFPFGQEPRAALAVRVRSAAGPSELVFISTHLSHNSDEVRMDQARQLNRLFGRPEGAPTILAGDLNAKTGSRPINELVSEKWIDATAPQSIIDYVLLRRNEAWRVVEVQTIDDRVASDHRPVLAVLEWTGDR